MPVSHRFRLPTRLLLSSIGLAVWCAMLTRAVMG